MDKLTKYRQKIKKVLTEYHDWVSGSAHLDQESCLVFDEAHDRDFWLFMGWEGKKKSAIFKFIFGLRIIKFTLKKIGQRKELPMSY